MPRVPKGKRPAHQKGGKPKVGVFSLLSPLMLHIETRLQVEDVEPMNKLEHAYAELLETLRTRGAIASWSFEAVKFRIGDGAFFTPDFEVVKPDGHIEYIDTKGYQETAALVRIKAAAQIFPHHSFFIVEKRLVRDGGGFEKRRVKCRPGPMQFSINRIE